MKTKHNETAAKKDSARRTMMLVGAAQLQVERAKTEIMSTVTMNTLGRNPDINAAFRELMEAWDSLQRAQDKVQAILTA